MNELAYFEMFKAVMFTLSSAFVFYFVLRLIFWVWFSLFK